MNQRGKRMQEEVLAVLRSRRAPLSAYEMLERLRRDNPRPGAPRDRDSRAVRGVRTRIGRGRPAASGAGQRAAAATRPAALKRERTFFP